MVSLLSFIRPLLPGFLYRESTVACIVSVFPFRSQVASLALFSFLRTRVLMFFNPWFLCFVHIDLVSGIVLCWNTACVVLRSSLLCSPWLFWSHIMFWNSLSNVPSSVSSQRFEIVASSVFSVFSFLFPNPRVVYWVDVAAERNLQLNYWKEHSIVPSVEAMMLDSQASKLDQEERPEVHARSVCCWYGLDPCLGDLIDSARHGTFVLEV